MVVELVETTSIDSHFFRINVKLVTLGTFMIKKFFAVLSVLLILTPVFAKTSFSVHDLDSSNHLLYSVNNNFGGEDFSTLFDCLLGKTSMDGKSKPLTCLPEKIEILGNDNVQIRNSFGEARYNLSSGKLLWTKWVGDFQTSFYESPVHVESPDGKWICVEEKNQGLFLEQVSTGLKVKISDESENSDLIKWSDDSRFFLYEENGVIYFASTDAAIKKLLPPSSMRKIGEGTLDCVQWCGAELFYVCGDIVYKIDQGELYTRGLFYPVLGSGTPIARLTNNFDSFHDSFSVSPDKKYLLHLTSTKLATLYALPQTFGFMSAIQMESLVGLSGSILDVKSFWTSDSVPVLWIENLSYTKGKKSVSVYSMDKGLKLLSQYDESRYFALSQDKKNLALGYGESLEIRQIDGWKLLKKFDDEKILSLKWMGKNSLVAGGVKTLSRIDYKNSAWGKTVLTLSSVKNSCYENGNIRAWTDSDRLCYEYDRVKNSWSLLGKKNAPVNKGFALNGKFRAYTAECPNQSFENAVFVRSLVAPIFTYSLIEETSVEKKSSGSVTLVFDCTTGNEGLAQVLAVLEKFGLRSTFFMNGEFIRRYPLETCQIVASGNKCASGFFTTADLLSSDFKIDADFIQRGLARNEDEFFAATGKELELLWHAPNFHCDDMMIEAGYAAGYDYLDSSIDFSDRVSFEDSLKSGQYFTAHQLIEKIVENLHDGMVVCVDVGNIGGSRSDYLYEKVEDLIKSIQSQGFEIN